MTFFRRACLTFPRGSRAIVQHIRLLNFVHIDVKEAQQRRQRGRCARDEGGLCPWRKPESVLYERCGLKCRVRDGSFAQSTAYLLPCFVV